MSPKKTKGERLESVLDFVLAMVTVVLGAALFAAVVYAWQNGAGWVVLPLALLAVTVASFATYIESGSDVYS
jgi:putative flippase GtrA